MSNFCRIFFFVLFAERAEGEPAIVCSRQMTYEDIKKQKVFTRQTTTHFAFFFFTFEIIDNRPSGFMRTSAMHSLMED